MTTMADPGIRTLGALAIVIGLLVALLNEEVELFAVLAVATGIGLRVEAALRAVGPRREDAEAPSDSL
jgi:hypothetical protein